MRVHTFGSVIVALFIGACGLAAPARATDLPPLRASQPPFFTADVSVSVDSSARSTVTATVTVPYAEMSWTKLPGDTYRAGVGLVVEFEPRDRGRLFGDSWEKRLIIEGYAATHSSRNNLLVTRSFPVPPGRYHVRVRVRDLGSDQESSADDQFTVADLSRVPVGFSDLALGVLDSLGVFTMLPTRAFGYNSGQIAAQATLFDRRPGPWPRRATFHYRVLAETGDPVLTGDTLVTLAASAQPVLVRPAHAGDLFLGAYTFEIELVEGKSRWRTSRSFEVDESGPPRGKAFEQMLEALSYIADSREVDALRNLPADQQGAAWERFWRRRDPTPDTPRNEFQLEFFRRLRYSEQHFQGFGPGWRSDMGRIYIRYGPPDQVEQQPASATSYPLEIWYYNQPYRRFIFEDREGFGRYTLRQPISE